MASFACSSRYDEHGQQSIVSGLEDDKWMEMAIKLARQCTPVATAYNVGAVLLLTSSNNNNTKLIATGYSRELAGNTHAEQCCFIKAAQANNHRVLSDDERYVLYSTMEPCAKRLSGSESCCSRIVSFNVHSVVIGVKEPDHFVADAQGSNCLLINGVSVRWIANPQLKHQCADLNAHLHNIHNQHNKDLIPPNNTIDTNSFTATTLSI